MAPPTAVPDFDHNNPVIRFYTALYFVLYHLQHGSDQDRPLDIPRGLIHVSDWNPSQQVASAVMRLLHREAYPTRRALNNNRRFTHLSLMVHPDQVNPNPADFRVRYAVHLMFPFSSG